MKLILHFGIHKTGTSALHQTLSDNYSTLLESGIYYPLDFTSILTPDDTATTGHMKFGKILFIPNSLAAESKIKKLISNAKKKNAHSIILSSEAYFTPRIKIHPSCGQLLLNFFSDLEIVMHLRRVDNWADQMYRDVLCWPRKRETRNYDAFCKEFLSEWLFWGDRIGNLAKKFQPAEIKLISFDDIENGKIENFTANLGINSHQQFKEIYTNPSLPYSNISDLINLNKQNISDTEKSQITKAMFRELSNSGKVNTFNFKSSNYLKSIKQSLEKDIKKIKNIDNVRMIGKFDNFFQPLNFKSKVITEKCLTNDFFDAQLALIGKNKKSVITPDTNGILLNVFTNETLENIVFHIEYHIALDIDKILVQYDGIYPAKLNEIYGNNNKVEIISCDDEFYKSLNLEEPKTNAEKLSHAHKFAFNYAKKHLFKWHMNIDSDELIYIDNKRSFIDNLDKLSADQIIITPLEAVHLKEQKNKIFATRYFKIPTIVDNRNLKARLIYFFGNLFINLSLDTLIMLNRITKKRNFAKSHSLTSRLLKFVLRVENKLDSSKSGIYWTKKAKEITQQSFPLGIQLMTRNFLGHTQGRTVSNTNLYLDDFESHRHQSSSQKINKVFSRKIYILHYDAINFDHWVKKMDNRVFGDASVIKISEKRYFQQIQYKEYALSERRDELFENIFCISEENIKLNIKYNLIKKIDNELMLNVFAKTTKLVN